jgi:hypothetical protein
VFDLLDEEQVQVVELVVLHKLLYDEETAVVVLVVHAVVEMMEENLQVRQGDCKDVVDQLDYHETMKAVVAAVDLME